MAEVKMTRSFNVPAGRLWEVLTQPGEMKNWYFHVRDFELKEGCVFTFYEKEEGGSFLHRCEILRVEPGQVFEHTWEHPSHSEGKSLLRWEIHPSGAGSSVLHLTHSGLENFADAGPEFAPENYEFGWKGIAGISLRNYLYGIRKLKWDIEIRASKEKVWEKMWGSYNEWTSVFDAGSRLEGELKQGARVHLLSASGGGMYSDVLFLQPFRYLVFSHIGVLENGEEQPLDAETEMWSGSLESYALTEEDGITRLKVELDCAPEYVEKMNQIFPEALEKLKQISE